LIGTTARLGATPSGGGGEDQALTGGARAPAAPVSRVDETCPAGSGATVAGTNAIRVGGVATAGPRPALACQKQQAACIRWFGSGTCCGGCLAPSSCPPRHKAWAGSDATSASPRRCGIEAPGSAICSSKASAARNQPRPLIFGSHRSGSGPIAFARIGMKLTNAKPILLDRELINQGGRGVRKNPLRGIWPAPMRARHCKLIVNLRIFIAT